MMFRLSMMIGAVGRWLLDSGPSTSPHVLRWHRLREARRLAERQEQARDAKGAVTARDKSDPGGS